MKAFPITTDTDSGSTTIVDTRENILAETPDNGTAAYATDTNEVFIYYNEWLQSSEILKARTGSVDMGVSQDSNLAGYGDEYITDKLISNCSIGSNADEKNGAIRKVFASPLGRNLFQFWADGQWQTVLTGVNIQTDSTEAIPDMEFTDFSPWVLSLITGDSDAKDFNGEPIVKQMKIDMGAFSAPLTIDGGSF